MMAMIMTMGCVSWIIMISNVSNAGPFAPLRMEKNGEYWGAKVMF